MIGSRRQCPLHVLSVLVSGRKKHSTSKSHMQQPMRLYHDKSHLHYAPTATFTHTVRRALHAHMYTELWTIVWYTHAYMRTLRHARNTHGIASILAALDENRVYT